MEGIDDMSEKNEKATPYKLQKAKEQGQVSKSTELNTCIFLLISLVVANALWPTSLLHLKKLLMRIFYLNAHTTFSVDLMSELQQFLNLKLTFLWLPFALAGMLSIVLSTIAQTGFVWSTKPLAPDFKRLSFSNGFKRLFSTKLLFDAVKNSARVGLVFLLLSISLRHELPVFLSFMKSTPVHYTPMLIKLISKITLQLLTLLFALAIIDKLYTHWKFGKDNRMSKQELKDEYRQREGDPKVKAKIKQLQQQLRRKTASLEQIKTADVVITNPTHLAVALKYDRGLMPAPKVVCKAQGELVKQVKQLAARYHVPIIEHKPCARLLFASTDLNQWIDREHFPMVALIFRELYRKDALA